MSAHVYETTPHVKKPLILFERATPLGTAALQSNHRPLSAGPVSEGAGDTNPLFTRLLSIAAQPMKCPCD